MCSAFWSSIWLWYFCDCWQGLWVRQQLFRRNVTIQAQSDAEKKLAEVLKAQINASRITVKDISG